MLIGCQEETKWMLFFARVDARLNGYEQSIEMLSESFYINQDTRGNSVTPTQGSLIIWVSKHI